MIPLATSKETRKEIEHSYVSANGIKFHVATAGDPSAPMLLFLHGFPECWYSWRHQLKAFSEDYYCVAPDLRGYGDSEKPRGGYDSENLSEDVAGLIHALGHTRATVVGHDWGGAIAWHTPVYRPDVVERVAVFNCPPPDVMQTALRRNFRQLRRSWYIFFFQVPLLPELRLTKNRASMIPQAFMAGATRRTAFRSEDFEIYREAMSKPGAASGALAYYRAAMRENMFRRAKTGRISCPGLVVWGCDDPFLGIELTYGLETRFDAPFTLRYIQGCGHWTQQEAPEEVNSALLQFLRAPLKPAR